MSPIKNQNDTSHWIKFNNYYFTIFSRILQKKIPAYRNCYESAGIFNGIGLAFPFNTDMDRKIHRIRRHPVFFMGSNDDFDRHNFDLFHLWSGGAGAPSF